MRSRPVLALLAFGLACSPGGAPAVRPIGHGLTMQLSGEVAVSENPVRAGSVRVTSAEFGALTVSEVGASTLTQTYAEAKKDMAVFNPKHVSRDEPRPDGWLLVFENEGGLGTNFFVWVRKHFGAQRYQCEAMSSTAPQAAAAARACLSLERG